MANDRKSDRQHSTISSPLMMRDENGQSVLLKSPRLRLVAKEGRPHAVSLTFQIAPATYALLESQQTFNLTPEVREDLDGPSFNSENPIEIQAALHPQFLTILAPFVANLDAAEPFLLSLAQTEPSAPLLQTSSWYATEVSQRSKKGVSRYRTLWYRLKLSANTMEKIESGVANQEIQQFLQKKIGIDFALLPDEFSPATIESLTAEVTQSITGGLSDLFSTLADEVASDQAAEGQGDDETSARSPLDQVAIFLEEDGWSWRPHPNRTAILTGATGDHGDFLCQILWEPVNQYLVCYAVAPVETAPERLAAMTELVGRANYGMPAGCFELNLADGEVRFRSSHFIAGRHSDDEIETLVYTAVYNMDNYLPAIRQVNDGVSPSVAITAVEDR
jgi:hypothetical protein